MTHEGTPSETPIAPTFEEMVEAYGDQHIGGDDNEPTLNQLIALEEKYCPADDEVRLDETKRRNYIARQLGPKVLSEAHVEALSEEVDFDYGTDEPEAEPHAEQDSRADAEKGAEIETMNLGDAVEQAQEQRQAVELAHAKKK